jgi:hypothetical protein
MGVESRDDDKVAEASLGKDARRNLMGLRRGRGHQSIHRREMDGVFAGWRNGWDGLTAAARATVREELRKEKKKMGMGKADKDFRWLSLSGLWRRRDLGPGVPR